MVIEKSYKRDKSFLEGVKKTKLDNLLLSYNVKVDSHFNYTFCFVLTV